ncbi:MAG TPA: rhomboid family intramembrane serine protease [Polyangiaceae bacterium]|jgi:membrane associated rhomboid family serine protease|nr:rhomboid family intramembrane serine protease [Polyangiaceae bacterium]
MARWESQSPEMQLPRPGRALKAILILLLGLWLMFAMALNWGNADPAIFRFFAGDTNAILQGQIWRFFTAPLIHSPNDPWHVVGSMLGLYFLGASLEQSWGGRRFIFFLLWSGVLAYVFQFLGELLLPERIASHMSAGIWFGSIPVIEAISVAWALNFRGQTVRLMFLLPITARGLLAFVIGFSVLRLIAVQQTPEGLLSPFGGLAAGWLLGGGTPSPLRRLYLKFRYAQLEREAAQERKERARRAKKGPFSVIEGGRGRRDSERGNGGNSHLN